MITTILSSRVYYMDLPDCDADMIHHDIFLYQSMKNHAYNVLYNKDRDDSDINLSSTDLKKVYGTNDYMPLSAISEAKGILKSNITWAKKTVKNMLSESDKIEKKIIEEEKKLEKCNACLSSIISYSRNKNSSIKGIRFRKIEDLKWYKKNPECCIYKEEEMSLYIFEVRYLKPMIQRIRNRIKLLRYRFRNLRFRIDNRLNYMPRAKFKEKNYMKITGRAQGKYCNNLFKYDYTEHMMAYIASDQRRIKFPLIFPYKGEELIRVLKMGHATKGKAVCYTLTDHGDYFIISASITLPDKNIEFSSSNGVIGIDINIDHIAWSETDGYGNMLKCGSIYFNLEHKDSHQRKYIIENVVIEIMKICTETNKPLVKENLDFEEAKKEMKIYNSNKKNNKILSEFSYQMIDEKIASRAYKDNVAVRRVDPAYTSRIGDMKYRREKGITVHNSASYVIGRRGMGYKERVYGY